MADREKVIKGLECCLSGPMQCGKCPYKTDVDISIPHCVRDLRENAIELLKAQEVPGTNVGEWTTKRTQEHDGEWYCSECGYEPIVMSDDMKYCPGCGRKMTMPEPPKEG